jgi:hypothetical protein
LFILVGLIFILPQLGDAAGFEIEPFTWLIDGLAQFVTGVIVGVGGVK